MAKQKIDSPYGIVRPEARRKIFQINFNGNPLGGASSVDTIAVATMQPKNAIFITRIRVYASLTKVSGAIEQADTLLTVKTLATIQENPDAVYNFTAGLFDNLNFYLATSKESQAQSHDVGLMVAGRNTVTFSVQASGFNGVAGDSVSGYIEIEYTDVLIP
jgi:hypothetical protein